MGTLHTADAIRAASIANAKEMVRHNLENSNEWLVRGLIAIFRKQTETEKASEQTHLHNAVGFNSSDAMILTSYSKQWLSKSWLSDKQLVIIRRKLRKYSTQLVRIARQSAKPAQVVA